MGSSAKPIVAIFAVVAAALAFWMLALSPKRSEADKLGKQAEQLTMSIESGRSELARATAARHTFPATYHQLVELGQAVPSADETSSLLFELNQIATESGVRFDSMQLTGEGSGNEAPVTSTEGSTSSASATEVAASLLPLGASVGSAGLATMPYNLKFQGNFFEIGSFIGRIDSLVKSGRHVAVDGRLVTINGFSLLAEDEGEGEKGGAKVLSAEFSVTTYLTPPGQNETAGATPNGPAESSTQTVAAR
jgi:Tfp pilus assembly protein PilO